MRVTGRSMVVLVAFELGYLTPHVAINQLLVAFGLLLVYA